MCVRCAQTRDGVMESSEKSDDLINSLIGQLQNCVNHLEHAKRHTVSTNHIYDGAIEAANNVIYRAANRGKTEKRMMIDKTTQQFETASLDTVFI
jgi:hypothetical protein